MTGRDLMEALKRLTFDELKLQVVIEDSEYGIDLADEPYVTELDSYDRRTLSQLNSLADVDLSKAIMLR